MCHISSVFYFEYFKHHNSLWWQHFWEHFQQNTRRKRILINKKKYNICQKNGANGAQIRQFSYARSGKSSGERAKITSVVAKRHLWYWKLRRQLSEDVRKDFPPSSLSDIFKSRTATPMNIPKLFVLSGETVLEDRTLIYPRSSLTLNPTVAHIFRL